MPLHNKYVIKMRAELLNCVAHIIKEYRTPPAPSWFDQVLAVLNDPKLPDIDKLHKCCLITTEPQQIYSYSLPYNAGFFYRGSGYPWGVETRIIDDCIYEIKRSGATRGLLESKEREHCLWLILTKAIQLSHENSFKTILALENIDINDRTYESATHTIRDSLLLSVIKSKQPNSVKFRFIDILLDGGCKTKPGELEAAIEENDELAEYLIVQTLANQNDFLNEYATYSTCLNKAIKSRQFKTTYALAKFDIRNHEKMTFLMQSMRMLSLSLADLKFLLAAGANPNIKSRSRPYTDVTALYLLMEYLVESPRIRFLPAPAADSPATSIWDRDIENIPFDHQEKAIKAKNLVLPCIRILIQYGAEVANTNTEIDPYNTPINIAKRISPELAEAMLIDAAWAKREAMLKFRGRTKPDTMGGIFYREAIAPAAGDAGRPDAQALVSNRDL
jgi:hypothetical protein